MHSSTSQHLKFQKGLDSPRAQKSGPAAGARSAHRQAGASRNRAAEARHAVSESHRNKGKQEIWHGGHNVVTAEHGQASVCGQDHVMQNQTVRMQYQTVRELDE